MIEHVTRYQLRLDRPVPAREIDAMYLPKSFEVTDSDKLIDVICRFSFATLITTVDGVPFATHLPILHRPQAGTAGVLVGHVARANPQ